MKEVFIKGKYTHVMLRIPIHDTSTLLYKGSTRGKINYFPVMSQNTIQKNKPLVSFLMKICATNRSFLQRLATF